MKNSIQKQLKPLSAITFAAMMAVTAPLYAAGEHAHGDDDHGGSNHESGMKHESHGDSHDHHDSAKDHGNHGAEKGAMFLVKKEIDGYDVTFHVMKAKPGKEMGGTHDFMVKVEKNGKALTNIVMNTKVKYPNGSSETKKTMTMGDWLMAGYDLGHEGKHQLMILFKTADGEKHKGGVYYPGR